MLLYGTNTAEIHVLRHPVVLYLIASLNKTSKQVNIQHIHRESGVSESDDESKRLFGDCVGEDKKNEIK